MARAEVVSVAIPMTFKKRRGRRLREIAPVDQRVTDDRRRGPPPCAVMTLAWLASGRCVIDSKSIKAFSGRSLLEDCLRQPPRR